FLPSKLVLREDGNYTSGAPNAANAALYPITIEVLKVMFGKATVDPTSPMKIDWNGNGTIDAGEFVLEGEECLVFYLGGIPTAPGSAPGCQGFVKGTNPSPLVVPAGAQRTTPFQFDQGR